MAHGNLLMPEAHRLGRPVLVGTTSVEMLGIA